MGFFDKIKELGSKHLEQINNLRERAEHMDTRMLCKFLQHGSSFVLAAGPVLKDRLYDMSRSEMKELFEYCRENRYFHACQIIKSFVENN